MTAIEIKNSRIAYNGNTIKEALKQEPLEDIVKFGYSKLWTNTPLSDDKKYYLISNPEHGFVPCRDNKIHKKVDIFYFVSTKSESISGDLIKKVFINTECTKYTKDMLSNFRSKYLIGDKTIDAYPINDTYRYFIRIKCNTLVAIRDRARY